MNVDLDAKTNSIAESVTTKGLLVMRPSRGGKYVINLRNVMSPHSMMANRSLDSLRDNKAAVRRSWLGLCSLLILLVLCGVSSWSHAQIAGATVAGTITDGSGAVVPGAKVAIKNSSTGIIVSADVNSVGFYSVPNLQPGSYEVTVSAAGFKTYVHSGILLTVGEQQALNIPLEIGQVNERVEVTGEQPSVELTSSAISGVVNSTTIVGLPLNGRDWTALATLEPAVNTIETQQPVSASSARGNRGFGTQLTIAGNRPQSNNYRIDGVSVVDYSGGSPGSVSGYALGVDAVGEFSVITSNYSAEYGRTSGGVVNAVTRSGTNQFHGNAYGFLRSAALDARSFFDTTPPPPFHRSQFGGSIGGPIQKNKTFFFFDYEGLRQGQAVTAVDNVPNQAARSGLIHLNAPLPADCVPANPSDPTACQVRVDPTAATYLQFYPLPNGPALGPDTSIFNIAINNVVHDNFLTTRIDHKFSDNDNLSGTYLYDNGLNDQPDPFNTTLFGNNSTRQTISIQENHNFSQILTNSARIGFSRMTALSNNSLGAINPLSAQMGLGAFGRQASTVSVTGLTQFSGGENALAAPFQFWNAYQAYDDAFFVRGNHSFKFGVSFERDQDNTHYLNRVNGDFSFGSLYGFLTNKPVTFVGSPTGETNQALRQTIFGAYIQDDWKLKPNLTLNLGLRYEMSTVPTAIKDQLVNLRSLTAPTSTLGSPWFSNPTLTNFEPRVGLAWDPFHNGATSVRAAFGFFDVLPLISEFFVMADASAPFSLLISTGNLAPGAFPSGLNNASADPSTLQTTWIQPNPARNYVMVWNLNIQQQVTKTVTASVGYVGNHGVHMYNREDDINTVLPLQTVPRVYFPLTTGANARLNPAVGDIRGGYWGGTQLYDALEASVIKSFSSGLQAQASYTFGKGIDTGSATAIGDPFTNSIASPFNFWPGRKGLSDYNIAQTFVTNFIWNIPSPKRWQNAASELLKGWQIGGIFTAQTGQPFTPILGGDPLGLSSADPWDFPDVNPKCKTTNPGNAKNYLNLNCFSLPTMPSSMAAICLPNSFPGATAAPPPGQIYCQNLMGNEGRNSIIGPGYFNLDSSLFKNTAIKRISDTFNVQIRAEFFNVLNHAAFLTPVSNSTLFDSTGAPVAGAGAINQLAVPARQIQFGLKIIF
jgi:Carboxypeptidase regulatory-like domain/TonB-dependent Receptor Plug Domain/TonB dependent receptor